MKRTEAREAAFKLLYSLQLMEDVNIDEQIAIFIEKVRFRPGFRKKKKAVRNHPEQPSESEIKDLISLRVRPLR